MSLLARASARHLRRHPWQLGLAVLGIALGVAMVVAVDLANGSARRAFQLSMDGVAGRATHQIVGGPAGLDERLYTRLRLAGVRASAPVVEAYGTIGGETVHLLGVDPLAEAGFRRHLAQTGGAAIGTLIAAPDTALLAAPTARRLAVAAGETVELRLGGRRHALRLIGLIEAGEAAAIDGLLLTDIATAQEITGTAGRLSWIDLRLPPGPEGAAARAAVTRLLPPGATLVPAGLRSRALGEMSAAFHTNLTAMSLLALTVGLFLIYHTMSFAVVQRRGLIGSLRLLGVTRREVLALVMAEALAIGLLATVLGLAGGLALGRVLLQLVSRTINDLYFALSVQTLLLTPGPFVKAGLLGLAATALAALAPALEAAGTSPQAALRRSVLEAKSHTLMPRLALAGVVAMALAALILLWPGRSLGGGFAALFLLILGMTGLCPLLTVALVRLTDRLGGRRAGVTLHLAVRGVAAALSRTGVAIAALMLAVAAIVGVGVMIASFRGTVDDWLHATLRADIFVASPGFGTPRTASRLDAGLVERLLQLPGIAAHSTGRRLTLESAGGLTGVFVLGLSPGLEPRYPLQAGDPARVWPAFRAGAAVLVSEPLAYHRRLAPGDRIRLRTDHGERDFAIAGIYYDYGSSAGEVLMPRPLYERHFDDRSISGLGLYLAPGAELETVLAAVRAVVAAGGDGQAVTVRSNRALRELSLAVFDRTFTITEVLRLLAIVVAAAAILSALLALQLERARETGVLRALGFTPRQVGALATVQTGLMGAIAGLLALPVGLTLALLLIHVINRRAFGWSLQTEIPPETLAQGLLIAVAAALLAGLYPAWRMGRTPPAEALREE